MTQAQLRRPPTRCSRVASTAPSARSARSGGPAYPRRRPGARVRDADGSWYLDYIGSWGPAILGHGRPAVIEAVREAALNGFALGATGPLEVELGTRSAPRCPRWSGCASVVGTEAVMSAIRLARGATGAT